MTHKQLFPIGSSTRDPFIKKSFPLTAVFVVTQALIIAFAYSRLPPLIPLFLSLTRGEKQLAPKLFILLLPTLSILTLTIHTLLARYFFTRDRTLARLIALTSVAINLFLFLSLFHIIRIML